MLTIDRIKRMIQPICEKYGVERLFLFGSYARNEATEKSDVDFRIDR
ncbi:MAG: nucleotidyltransferase domain-containing protein, partial [Schwartzia sp.]|nr:nucleotidyltransferase domain-containing protein [Schwartzia sp. (in: firmicutes)]